MKKALFLILVFMLGGCVTERKMPVKRAINFTQVRKLIVGKSTATDVIRSLGTPGGRVASSDSYILNYDDTEGFKRLTLNFSNSDNRLMSYLWIPKPREREASLATVKNEFKNINVKEVPTSEQDSHFFAEMLSQSESQSGVTIRFNRQSKVVEAISVY